MKHLCHRIISGQACLPHLERSDCGQASPKAGHCGGQVMIFLLMVLLILATAIIWNFDLHKVIHLKMRSQNAADASALAAARWQAVTLNLIGDLNIMQAVALSINDGDLAGQIAETQSRLCYAGPLVGLLASQQAAKNNGIYVSKSFSERMATHANSVLADYSAVFAEPYAGCWNEYGTMIKSVAAAGVAAAPDNTAYYTDYSGGHILLSMDFYNAIAGQEWCWFYWYAWTILQTYLDYESWPALPPQVPQSQPENSEIYGLGLTTLSTLPGGTPTVAKMNSLRTERNLGTQTISNSVATTAAKWFIYQSSKWSDWPIMKDPSFPIFPEKHVKPQYDYAGADAVTRIEAVSERLMPSASDRRISCTAAAKPFGYLTTDEGTQIRPDSYQIVLPAFHDVRLIPVDASSSPSGGAYDLAWRDHIETHLPLYVESGLEGLSADCWYCQQLRTWEDPLFRQDMIDWVQEHCIEHTCVRSGSGPGPGGGARRGH